MNPVFWTILSRVEMCASWLARPLRLAVGTVWAACLLLLGLWVWERQVGFGAQWLSPTTAGPHLGEQVARGLAVFAVSGAHFVFMFLVADDLCPRAAVGVRQFLQFFTGSLSLGALGWTGWLVFSMLQG